MSESQPVSTQRKAIEAESLAARWLADGNEARESGKTDKAERCYAKAQYWLDRFNKLTGRE
jgi:hypothetical protein